MALKVRFKKSGRTVEWSDIYANLLELAEDNDIEIESECEAGVCGTCKTRLISGRVDMELTDGLEPEDEEENMILPCVAVPVTDIVLDA